MTEETLPQKLRVKADMIALCERIQWGSETSLMREAADRIEELEAQISNLTNLNNSLSEQNTTLLKRMDAAMNYIKAIEGDAYKLSAVYLILNGGKDGD